MKPQWQSSPPLIFKNNFRKRQISAVGNGDGDIFHAEPVGDPFRRAFQTQGWLSARFSYHFDIAPAYAAPPSRPQGFHRCLFRGETARVALEFISVAFAIRYFARSVQPLENRRAVSRDGRLDSVNFGNVQSQPDYQLILGPAGSKLSRNLVAKQNCIAAQLYL